MANLQEILDTQKRIEECLSARMADFEKNISTAVSSESKPTLDKLTQDYKSFKDTVWSILQMLRSQIQSLTLQIDELETYNRRNALLFNGINEMNNEDCITVIMEVINTTMKLKEVSSSSIYLCHRLGAKNTGHTRPLLIRFNDHKTRNLIWMEKKRLKSSAIVLSEFLTRPRQAIFNTARRYFGVHHCWTRNRAVYMKLPNKNASVLLQLKS